MTPGNIVFDIESSGDLIDGEEGDLSDISCEGSSGSGNRRHQLEINTGVIYSSVESR